MERGRTGMSERCRILIAEDEYITQQGIRHLLDWEQEGFEIVGTVSNGRDALLLAEELKPHIVLTDVVMPIMNGVELTGLLRTQFPDIQVVVLSGYSDFEYVRGSFQGGVVDYILKSTLNPDELLKIMRRTAQRIPGLELQRGSPSPESQLCQLLTGMQGGDIPAVLAEALPRPKLMLLGFPVGRILRLKRDALEVQSAVLSQCAADSLAAFPHLQIIADTDILLLVISFFASEETECLAAAKEAVKRCAEVEPAVFYIASESFCGLDNLRETYHGTFFKKLESFFYHQGTSFLHERDIRPTAIPRLDGQRLANLLGDSRLVDVFSLLQDYVSLALAAKAPDELELKSLVQNALYQIIARLEDMGLDAASLSHLKRDCMTKIQACTYAESFQETTAQILEDLTAILDTYGLCAHNATMGNILAYIDTHYADPITLQSIAKQFNFSYSYLSSYFHTHNNEGFSEQLNRVRIRHAAELLREGRLTVSEVCGAVGYGDQSYFTKVFKRYEGRTPSDYRRTTGGGTQHD